MPTTLSSMTANTVNKTNQMTKALLGSEKSKSTSQRMTQSEVTKVAVISPQAKQKVNDDLAVVASKQDDDDDLEVVEEVDRGLRDGQRFRTSG